MAEDTANVSAAISPLALDEASLYEPQFRLQRANTHFHPPGNRRS